MAAAFGVAAGKILELVTLGSSTTVAVQSTVAWISLGGGAAEEPPPDCLAGDAGAAVCRALEQAAALADRSASDAVDQLGRNCHLPTSLQTALHAALHVEWEHGIRTTPDGGRRAAEAPAHGSAWPEAAAAACLPCSADGPPGGGACSLALGEESPGGKPAGPAAPLPCPSPAASGPAILPGVAWVRGVRLALSQGGCCASRASFSGACLGAMVGMAGIPHDWMGRVAGHEDSLRLGEELVKHHGHL